MPHNTRKEILGKVFWDLETRATVHLLFVHPFNGRLYDYTAGVADPSDDLSVFVSGRPGVRTALRPRDAIPQWMLDEMATASPIGMPLVPNTIGHDVSPNGRPLDSDGEEESEEESDGEEEDDADDEEEEDEYNHDDGDGEWVISEQGNHVPATQRLGKQLPAIDPRAMPWATKAVPALQPPVSTRATDVHGKASRKVPATSDPASALASSSKRHRSEVKSDEEVNSRDLQKHRHQAPKADDNPETDFLDDKTPEVQKPPKSRRRSRRNTAKLRDDNDNDNKGSAEDNFTPQPKKRRSRRAKPKPKPKPIDISQPRALIDALQSTSRLGSLFRRAYGLPEQGGRLRDLEDSDLTELNSSSAPIYGSRYGTLELDDNEVWKLGEGDDGVDVDAQEVEAEGERAVSGSVEGAGGEEQGMG